MPDWRIFFLAETGSTNDDARLLSEKYAGEFVVWAHKQTAGRGRENRSWESTADGSLTFTVLFRPTYEERQYLTRFTALGALALVDVLSNGYELKPEIKWPNDVLIRRKKVSGILTELVWKGSQLDGVVVGIGINVSNEAFNGVDQFRFPVTSLAEEGISLGSRQHFLEQILDALQVRREQVGTDQFLEDWNNRLAFRGEYLPITQYKGKTELLCPVSINSDGALIARNQAGNLLIVHSAEI